MKRTRMFELIGGPHDGLCVVDTGVKVGRLSYGWDGKGHAVIAVYERRGDRYYYTHAEVAP